MEDKSNMADGGGGSVDLGQTFDTTIHTTAIGFVLPNIKKNVKDFDLKTLYELLSNLYFKYVIRRPKKYVHFITLTKFE